MSGAAAAAGGAMDAVAFEQAILSGAAFANQEPSGRRAPGSARTPPRSPSPSTSDELGSALSDDGAEPTTPAIPSNRPGPNTGVKGVIADRNAHDSVKRQAHAKRVEKTNRKLASTALVADHSLEARHRTGRDREEERDDREEREELGRLRQEKLRELRGGSTSKAERLLGRNGNGADGGRGAGKLVIPQSGLSQGARSSGVAGARRFLSSTTFGHLREVDEATYADAIDRVPTGTIVVVHIYERSSSACAPITSALASLAREYSHIKFIQVRGASIQFGTTAAAIEEAAAEADEQDLEDLFEDNARDVTPTLLVYVGGELRGNFVRCDLAEGWGRGARGVHGSVRELLGSIDVIPADGLAPRGTYSAAHRGSSDEDEDEDE